MACYRPIDAYRSLEVNPKTGKRGIVFSPKKGYYDLPLKLPCGSCIGCRIDRSRQWAARCLHEASMHKKNCFLTLTYKDLPPGSSLNKRDIVLFMKRLRKEFGSGIRFFQVGEYGTLCRSCGKPELKIGQRDKLERFCTCETFMPTLGRPHHHVLLFNFDFPDKKWKFTRRNNHVYTSEILERLWPHGLSSIGEVTYQSAAYCARYITKKITGAKSGEHYGDRLPEYITMSRRPGIGAAWFDRYGDGVYPLDFIVVQGKKIKPPKYYDKLLEKKDFEILGQIKQRRQNFAKLNPLLGSRRLNDMEKSKFLTAKKLIRVLESTEG